MFNDIHNDRATKTQRFRFGGLALLKSDYVESEQIPLTSEGHS